MEREEAIERLKELVGRNVHGLAKRHGLEVRGPSGKVNKGWAGHTAERYLGLPLNSAQSPNFGSWELKVVPLKYLQSGKLVFKETMAVTMIDPHHVSRTSFSQSHLKTKLHKAVVLTRVVGKTVDDPSLFHSVFTLELEGDVLRQVKQDYEEVRRCLNDPDRGFDKLTGRMGTYIQPRTKGRGHGSTSRAFYARKKFLELFIDLGRWPTRSGR